MAHLLISAAHKSSGKTTVAVGLCAALAARGLDVRPFKKGPDYIDPMWLGAAAGRPCHNLDFYTMGRAEILATFARNAHGGDVALVEGNKGLYDGLDLDGSNSNAALADLLGAPVVLVIDARGMTRGIAPLILGYRAFDPNVRIAGVILNKIGGRRHESKLRAIIEHYTDVPVLGALQRDPELEISERHLGLIPSNEAGQARAKIEHLAEAVAEQVDLERLLTVAGTAIPIAAPSLPRRALGRGSEVRIGVARDSAFGFYYHGDLEALEAAGARLVPIDMLSQTRLPPLDGLFIGGGFPETHMAALEANGALRHGVGEAIRAGLPTHAECGGLMYLCRSLEWNGERREMVGVIPGNAVMHATPRGRGYVRLRETGHGPWAMAAGTEFPAHEFHYSSLEGLSLDSAATWAYDVVRGHGVDGHRDGLVMGNLLASYSHHRDVESNRWAQRFVEFARRCRAGAAPSAPLITRTGTMD